MYLFARLAEYQSDFLIESILLLNNEPQCHLLSRTRFHFSRFYICVSLLGELQYPEKDTTCSY